MSISRGTEEVNWLISSPSEINGICLDIIQK